MTDFLNYFTNATIYALFKKKHKHGWLQIKDFLKTYLQFTVIIFLVHSISIIMIDIPNISFQ